MQNPFTYGGVVGAEAFCNRRRELTDLKRFIENGDRVFLYSERRLGKTSLVKRALEQLPRKQVLGAYVDLWPTDNETGMAAAIARAISHSLATTPSKVLEAAQEFFSRLLPNLKVDGSGVPQLSFSLKDTAPQAPALEEVLRVPGEIARRKDKRVALVLDEFQRILEYGSDRAERILRSAMQEQPEVAFLFLGSRKHLVRGMFLDQNRPLYRSGAHYPLGPIETSAWLPFVRKRFERTGRRISRERVVELVELTDGHPFYTQHLCHALWELCLSGEDADGKLLQQALSVLLDRESYAYSALWESFTQNQRRLLRELARDEGSAVFGAEFLQASGLRTASSAQRSVDGLIARDVLDGDGSGLAFSDRFFRLWVLRNLV